VTKEKQLNPLLYSTQLDYPVERKQGAGIEIKEEEKRRKEKSTVKKVTQPSIYSATC